MCNELVLTLGKHEDTELNVVAKAPELDCQLYRVIISGADWSLLNSMAMYLHQVNNASNLFLP